VPKLDWSNSVPEGNHEMETQSPISRSSTYNIDHKRILAFWDVKSNYTKHIPEDHNLAIHCCENLGSHNVNTSVCWG